jgi:hypothetical protein
MLKRGGGEKPKTQENKDRCYITFMLRRGGENNQKHKHTLKNQENETAMQKEQT